MDPAGVIYAVREPVGIVSADGVSTGSPSADSDPAGGNPADSFPPAGSVEPADESNPAVSSSVSADLNSVYADESTLPPGQQLGTSENTTRFPVPSDVCMDQLSSGIFTSSSYDDDFRATLTNLAPAVEVNLVPTKRVNTIHPQSQILGDLASPVLTRSRAHKSKFGESAFIGYVQDQQRTNHTDQLHCLSACFLSQLEPTSIAKALEDPDWVDAMQEEMQQFINQQVWKLVPLPDGKHAIGTKWILKNKRDARGIVVRNKARLVAQGHRQEEGIDYDEVFAPVARIEAIRLFLAFASYMGFLVYQLDVKSAFLYGEIEEEVYVTQPKGFEDPYFPKHVYRVVKALYGLHQAPRAWFMWMTSSLESKIKAWCDEFEVFDERVNLMCVLDGSDFLIRSSGETVARWSLYQGNPLTGGMVNFMGRRVNFPGRLQNSCYCGYFFTEAEYVAAASCCAQVLWIQNQLLDYGFNFMNTKIFIDNQSTICIVKNPVFHQRTKHIEIRHHFIRDANEKNLIQVLKIHTDDNVADLLTKAFDGPRFAYLVVHIGMVDMVLVSAGCTMVLLVVILPAGRMVSAGCTMVLLVVIFPAGRLVSAGCTMVLLVVIFPAGRLVSAGFTLFGWIDGCAGCTMVLLVVIVPAGFFVPAGSYGLCCWFRVHAGKHTSAGRFISADRVFFLLSTWFLLLDDSFLLPIVTLGFSAGSIKFLLNHHGRHSSTKMITTDSLTWGWKEGSEGLLRYPQLLDHTSFKVRTYTCPSVVFDSLVKQFWATATVRPNAAGSHDLVATIDGREISGAYNLHCMEPNGWNWNQVPSSIATPLLIIDWDHHWERQPETEWVVPNPVSPGTDWRPWPSVPPPRTPTPPAQTLSFEEPLVFGPVPKPAGYVDPDTIDPIIFGPPPRPYDFVDPALEEPVIFGPLPRPANYIEPEDIDNLNSMEDDTTLGGFHEETHVGPDDAPTTTADAAGRAEDPALLTSLSAKIDRLLWDG
ncbi:putative ribonuclease H-like domain-containing protein [Tanacetum coccineum]